MRNMKEVKLQIEMLFIMAIIHYKLSTDQFMHTLLQFNPFLLKHFMPLTTSLSAHDKINFFF